VPEYEIYRPAELARQDPARQRVLDPLLDRRA
jgi:hypothetical protein